VGKKHFDPLWEVVGEKAPLQGGAPDIDAVCPWCGVTVHLGDEVVIGTSYECGLCGGVSKLVEKDGGVSLERLV